MLCQRSERETLISHKVYIFTGKIYCQESFKTLQDITSHIFHLRFSDQRKRSNLSICFVNINQQLLDIRQ